MSSDVPAVASHDEPSAAAVDAESPAPAAPEAAATSAAAADVLATAAAAAAAAAASTAVQPEQETAAEVAVAAALQQYADQGQWRQDGEGGAEDGRRQKEEVAEGAHPHVVGGGGSGGGKKRRREWLQWNLTKTVTRLSSPPPFGMAKPTPISPEEKATITSECSELFPVGFYEMTCKKRGVTKGRGEWKGKEALCLLHCTSERSGCRFKARFCRVMNGMEIWTSGEHDIEKHSAPPKRGLNPEARAFVTKYHKVSQKKLVQALKERGLIETDADLKKVKWQVKRRKLTVKCHKERREDKLSTATVASSMAGHPFPTRVDSGGGSDVAAAMGSVQSDCGGRQVSGGAAAPLGSGSGSVEAEDVAQGTRVAGEPHASDGYSGGHGVLCGSNSWADTDRGQPPVLLTDKPGGKDAGSVRADMGGDATLKPIDNVELAMEEV